MYSLQEWDESLVPDAEILAKFCVFNHAYAPNTVGQNLWMTTGTDENIAVGAVNSWGNEYYNPGGIQGHYTQVRIDETWIFLGKGIDSRV